jgi:uncharacterized protein (TIGR02001 family)
MGNGTGDFTMFVCKTAARTLAACAAALVCSAAPVSAEEKSFEWSVTATGTSDYIFRGLSLSGEKPVFQSSIDASYGIWYAGIWGSDLSDEGQVELDLYTGIKPELGPVTFDIGVVYYIYPWDNPSDDNYVEFKLGAEYSPVTNLTLKPVFWYLPDQDNYTESYAIEGTAAYEFAAVGIFTPTVSGLIGYTEGNDDPDYFATGVDSYTYWNAGLALSVEKFTFDFRYWDTDISNGIPAEEGLADERFVFTASMTLP